MIDKNMRSNSYPYLRQILTDFKIISLSYCGKFALLMIHIDMTYSKLIKFTGICFRLL